MSLKVYRGRTLARSQALQLLFQAEATDSPLERVLEGDFLISKGPLDPYALELCRGAYEHIDRIDWHTGDLLSNLVLLEADLRSKQNNIGIRGFRSRLRSGEGIDGALIALGSSCFLHLTDEHARGHSRSA